MSSSRPSTNRRPAVVEVADVAGGHHPVDHVLRAAAGVARRTSIELLTKMRPGLAGAGPAGRRRRGSRARAARRAAGGAGRGAQVRRRGDRDPRHLGRAVEVVDDVAELVHERAPRGRPASAEPLTRRRCAATSRSWLRRVVLVAGRGSAASITGTIGDAVDAAARSIVSSASPGSKLRRSTIVEPSQQRRAPRCAKPHSWNSGGGDQHLVAPRAAGSRRAARRRRRAPATLARARPSACRSCRR